MSILANWHGESDPVVRDFNVEHDTRPGTRLPNVTNSLLDGYRENFAAWTSQTQRITNMPVHLSADTRTSKRWFVCDSQPTGYNETWSRCKKWDYLHRTDPKDVTVEELQRITDDLKDASWEGFDCKKKKWTTFSPNAVKQFPARISDGKARRSIGMGIAEEEPSDDSIDEHREAQRQWLGNVIEVHKKSTTFDLTRPRYQKRYFLKDTGAQGSMVSSPLMPEHVDADNPDQFICGIGADKVQVTQRGRAQFQAIAESGQEYNFALNNVLYAQGAKADILSWGQMSEEGWTATLNAGGVAG